MEIRNYKNSDLETIIDLAKTSYNEEKAYLKILKPIEDYKNIINDMFYKRFGKNAFGKVLLIDNKIIGYLIGIKIENFWGKSKGFLSPIYGHFVKEKYRIQGYKLLYMALAKTLVEKEILSHAITMYTYDKNLIDTWFKLGFGLRCIDSIKAIKPKKEKISTKIKPITKTNATDFVSLEESLHMVFTESPMFMPRTETDGLEAILDTISKDDNYMFGAYNNNLEPIGIIKIGPVGDNFITTHKKMMNVKGLYIDKNHRKKGAARDLLAYCEKFLSDLGYELLGVDFESFNIYGSEFWHKNFSPYTNTVHRRIDEFIIENDK
ncbi:MAG: GNAT family N-acetyltransferase [Candidatus Izemoplasmatales bacterium]